MLVFFFNFPSFKFGPFLCPFHPTILSLATSRDKLSQIGTEKEEKVTANLFFAHLVSGLLNEWVCCICMGVCLRKSTPQGWDVGLHFASRPWSKEKLQLAGTSCFGRKHCHAGRAFLPVLEKQPALSLYFSSQPPWWPITMSTQASKCRLWVEVKLIKGDGCFEFVSATWTDIRETW